MFKKNIRSQIMVNFFIIILVIFIVFEIGMMYFVRYFYYSSVESILKTEIRLSADLFESYLNDNLSNIVLQDYDLFYRRTKAQVQLLDNTGFVLMDSIASPDLGQKLDTKDVLAVQQGKMERYIGEVPYSDSKVMSIAYPLRNNMEQIGIIRLTASLDRIEGIVKDISTRFFAFGAIVFAMTMLLSLIMARSIIKPLRSLTEVATQIAEGNFSVKARVDRSDEIGELAKTMNFMTESIVNKEQIKNDFISSISHELRTPLTSIKGWAITLQGEDIDDNQMMKDGLDIIEKESDRLSSMVEELLDFSRYVSGRITLHKEPINLVSLVKSILTQFKIRANNEKIDLILNFDHDPIMVLADKNRIKQVLINLLDNALKFTDEEGTGILNSMDSYDEVAFEVIDPGIGIDSQELQLVTERFYRGSSSRSHTGLGLSISEEIVQLHGGYIEILSTVGKGTHIKVVLPKGGFSRD